jgi:diaminohydroxyphosphoribosylaminopyrimidine deaminase / 5-amino-6-(5-phosphoribosylamino)uracil reductase
MNHDQFMHRCLTLAAQGRGLVGNGALVGACLVQDGTVLAEAYYSGFGNLHAERQVLEKYDQKISSDDVLYITLEPCVCFDGKKTPPCVDIIVERGIKTVVIGMLDPDPRVSGRGVAFLRGHGIQVIGPVECASCEWLNRGFTSTRTKQRPWVTLKQARTADGAIAATDGAPLRITSEEQDQWSHTFLRAQHDAILVGVQTIINDDPVLTPRMSAVPVAVQPWRIVLDPSVRTPVSARIVNDAHVSRTMIICAADQIESPAARFLSTKGARLVGIELRGQAFVWEQLWQALLTPAGDYVGLTSVLVEAGARSWEGFKHSGMVDQEVILMGSSSSM